MRRTTPARPPREGLTLLEVLVSMAIFLVSIAAIASLVDFGSQMSQSAAFQSMGTRFAQSKLAEVEAGAISVSAGESGTIDEDPAWNYAVESSATDAANVYAVTVRCYRDAGGKRHEVVLTQMVMDPAVMGGAAAAVPPALAASTTGGS